MPVSLKEEVEFIRNFAVQFNNVNESDLTFKTRFRDIEGWSSLTSLLVILMFDEIYRVKLNGDDIRNSETIEDLFNIVKSGNK